MSFAVAVSPRIRILHPWIIQVVHPTFHGCFLTWPLIGIGKFVLCRHSNSPISPNGSCYGASPLDGHVCVSFYQSISPIVWTKGLTNSSPGGSILSRGCWYSFWLQKQKSIPWKSLTPFVSFRCLTVFASLGY